MQGMQERVTPITTQTLFFTLELNRIDDAVLAASSKRPRRPFTRPGCAICARSATTSFPTRPSGCCMERDRVVGLGTPVRGNHRRSALPRERQGLDLG